MPALSPQQSKFINNYLGGMDASQAYRKAGYVCTPESAHTLSARALKRPAVKAAISAARKRMADDAHLTRNDIVGFLCETISTPIGSIDENHRQAQEHTSEESEARSASRIKMPGKLEAIKILNQMLGWNAPETHAHTFNVIIGGDAE